MEMTNGEIRQKVYDANGKFTYRWTFAGNARTFLNENAVNDELRLNTEEFDFVVDAVKRSKISERRRK